MVWQVPWAACQGCQTWPLCYRTLSFWLLCRWVARLPLHVCHPWQSSSGRHDGHGADSNSNVVMPPCEKTMGDVFKSPCLGLGQTICTSDVPLVEFMYLVFTRMPGERYCRLYVHLMYLWWSLYTSYLHTCQVRVTVDYMYIWCTSGGVYIPRIYTHARWELL